MSKAKISVRANNLISERIKVNDLRGNPIEMAAQVVWRVVDTAQALYDVDDYRAFVVVQIEAAVRTIGSFLSAGSPISFGRVEKPYPRRSMRYTS